MKTYGEVDVWIHVSLTLALVGSQIHAPAALHLGKDLPVPIRQEVGWGPRTNLGDAERENVAPTGTRNLTSCRSSP
jgi:hypothetical protein